MKVAPFAYCGISQHEPKKAIAEAIQFYHFSCISLKWTMNMPTTPPHPPDINTIHILEDAYKRDPNVAFEWAFNCVIHKLCNELVTLSRGDQGLHFRAKSASADYLEGSFMQEAALKMKRLSLWTWQMVQELLDANHRSCQSQKDKVNDKMASDIPTGDTNGNQTKKEKKAKRVKK